MQEVFIALWRGAATFDRDRGPARPWVLQIAHYRILNELRARGRQPLPEPGRGGQEPIDLPDAELDPAEAACRAEQRRVVRSAIAELPLAQRQAIDLAFFGGLSHQQVADRLDLPLGTAKTRIRAGLRQLRRQLAPLLAALVLLLGGTIGVLAERLGEAQTAREREHRALQLASDSATSTVRLSPAPGLPAEAHGRYLGKVGDPLAVVTISHVAPAPAGQTYQAWVRHGGIWTSLGTFQPNPDGRSLIIAEQSALATPPDVVEVTLEPDGGSPLPRGPVVLTFLR